MLYDGVSHMQANLVEISHWRFGLAVEHQLTLADAW
jgi:hypothetical protein